MTPLELIEKGIVTDSIDLVAEGYKMLTGKDVEAGSAKHNDIDGEKLYEAYQLLYELIKERHLQPEEKQEKSAIKKAISKPVKNIPLEQEDSPIEIATEQIAAEQIPLEEKEKENIFGKNIEFYTEAPTQEDIDYNDMIVKKSAGKIRRAPPKAKKCEGCGKDTSSFATIKGEKTPYCSACDTKRVLKGKDKN